MPAPVLATINMAAAARSKTPLMGWDCALPHGSGSPQPQIFLFKLIRLSHSDQQLSVLSGTYVSIFGPKYTTVSRASLGKVRYGEEGTCSLEAPHAELASPSCSFPHVRAQAFFEGVFVGWSWGY